MTDRKRWYAVYTRHRWEKKVFSLLVDKNIEAYCPLNKVQRKWSDRIKTIEEPLFKSYVFVKVGEDEKTTVRMTAGVINFVYWLGKPAMVKDREIITIKKFLNEHDNVQVERFQIITNSEVTINQGLFMDKKATVIKVTKNHVKVNIQSIGFSLIAYFDKRKVSPSAKDQI